MQPLIWRGMLTLPKWSPIIKITLWSCSPPSIFSSALILIQLGVSGFPLGRLSKPLWTKNWFYQIQHLTAPEYCTNIWNLCFHMRKNWRVLSWLMLRCSVEIFPNPATCLIYLIPTPLLKTLHGFFEVELLNIVNYFLQTSVFSTAFQRAVVRLLPRTNSEIKDS